MKRARFFLFDSRHSPLLLEYVQVLLTLAYRKRGRSESIRYCSIYCTCTVLGRILLGHGFPHKWLPLQSQTVTERPSCWRFPLPSQKRWQSCLGKRPSRLKMRQYRWRLPLPSKKWIKLFRKRPSHLKERPSRWRLPLLSQKVTKSLRKATKSLIRKTKSLATSLAKSKKVTKSLRKVTKSLERKTKSLVTSLAKSNKGDKVA